MEKLTTLLSKIVTFTLILLVSFSLTSCTREIPEGDIKNFVNNLDYNKAYEHVNSGKSVITASLYVDDVLDGQVTITTIIDKTDKLYQYMVTEVSGSYFGTAEDQYNYYKQEVLTYFDETNSVIVYKKTDGVLEDISYTEDDVYKSVNNFFYTSLDSNYHSGGVYYGDYVMVNCANYYSLFSINEDLTELTYAVNTKAKNEEDVEVVTMHKFRIDTYGMIIDLSSHSIMMGKGIELITTISCEYNMPVTKLETL